LFAPVRSLDQLARATATAGRPSMLFFHADWCTSCLEMERSVFPSPAVKAAMQHFALLQADVTADNVDDQALMAHFRMFGPPAVMFFDAKGQEIVSLRVMGYQPADRFAQTLTRALAVANEPATAASSVTSRANQAPAAEAASSARMLTGSAQAAGAVDKNVAAGDAPENHVSAILGQAIAARQSDGVRRAAAGQF